MFSFKHGWLILTITIDIGQVTGELIPDRLIFLPYSSFFQSGSSVLCCSYRPAHIPINCSRLNSPSQAPGLVARPKQSVVERHPLPPSSINQYHVQGPHDISSKSSNINKHCSRLLSQQSRQYQQSDARPTVTAPAESHRLATLIIRRGQLLQSRMGELQRKPSQATMQPVQLHKSHGAASTPVRTTK